MQVHVVTVHPLETEQVEEEWMGHSMAVVLTELR